MEEVTLKVKKASHFLDKLIKVTTFISFLLFAVSIYVYKYKSDDIYKNQIDVCDAVWSQGMTDTNPLNNPIHESFLTFKNNCFNNAVKTTQMWAKTAFIALDITVLLPLLYFGSKKVVKDSADKIKKVHELS